MSEKVGQQKINYIECIKTAYEAAKKKGLVVSRPITLSESGKPILNNEDSN